MTKDLSQFDFDPIDALLERFNLQHLVNSPLWREILERAGREVGAAAEAVFAEYPPESHRPLPKLYPRQRIKGGQATGETYMSKWKSKKQQGFFFAGLEDGRVTVPYRRTGQLGASFASAVNVVQEAVEVAVGTNLEYAPYVIGDEQAAYHTETGWPVIGRAIDERFQMLFDLFVESIERQLLEYLRGNP